MQDLIALFPELQSVSKVGNNIIARVRILHLPNREKYRTLEAIEDSILFQTGNEGCSLSIFDEEGFRQFYIGSGWKFPQIKLETLL